MSEPRIYNLKADKGDSFASSTFRLQVFTAENLPLSVDLRDKMPPVVNQGNLGSCTACATIAAFQYCDPTWFGSKLFVYYNTRMLDGTISRDAGSTLSQAVRAVSTYGVCSEVKWPYLVNNYSIQPSTDCYTQGLDHQALEFSRVTQTEAQMKGCLASGFPFVFGFWVYSSFENVGVNGVVSIPESTEVMLGGHAVVCVGYDDNRRVWICQNSWGTSWGDRGYFYMPYEYLDSERLATDLWKIQQVETTTTNNQSDNVIYVTPTVVEPVNPKRRSKFSQRYRLVPKLKRDITPEDKVLSNEQVRKELLVRLSM